MQYQNDWSMIILIYRSLVQSVKLKIVQPPHHELVIWKGHWIHQNNHNDQNNNNDYKEYIIKIIAMIKIIIFTMIRTLRINYKDDK